jgi:hypothetical protein
VLDGMDFAVTNNNWQIEFKSEVINA